MESWSFDFKSKVGSMDWELKSPFENSMVFMSQNAMAIDNQVFGGTSYPQIIGNSLLTPVMAATHNAFNEEHESSSELSSSIMESNSRDSGLFHLITNMPSKQKRTASLNSLSPFCKVHGCNKSLVACKDYHKRHKVCELHSKTDKVIVNGIEQRFCQQCSRFHLLTEFDDGKRSCRKRLADHNERRRKSYSSRHGRLLPRYSGKFKGSTRAKAKSSFMVEDLRSMSSVTNVQMCSSLHGENNGYAHAEDFITMDSMSALSLLSTQSEGSSSCHSSRTPTLWSNPLMIPLTQNADHASGVSNNMNPNGDWSGDLTYIDLMQLSSQLERVELQKKIS
ncbi:hypothetical protein L2E82_17032 [Cichorium intybus]|uniref:Uncharacterized protein n=1 Tax=Cichorium intybus TaxID=13427 RepID=A0ACB9F760_CICIN|nr:hypothetical protein L2E82_17032 [Cichorium intybus]